MHEPHPVQLVVEDDLRRNRVTVFFRLLLAIPHLVWVSLWSLAALLAAVLSWFAILITSRSPTGVHRFLCAYIRYTVHVSAYLFLTANPYPGFTGQEGSYPVDVRLPHEPQPQSRWKTLIRIVLALPAVLLGTFLGGGVSVPFNYAFRSGRRGSSDRFSGLGGGIGGALAGVCAILGWFASLALGRMPNGLRDASAYGIGYGAQVRGYTLLITDRYPSADPTALLESVPTPAPHPVRLVGDADDLRRSRVTVFFRLPLTIPHFVWLYLWGFVTELVVFLNWFFTLIVGRPFRPFYRFTAAYLRYQLHVFAFLTLAANPFPGFTGAPGLYPLDLELPAEPQRQRRAKTFFRLLLAVPAWVIGAVLVYAAFVAAFFTWFVALVRGEAPWGLRNLMAYALRYQGQVNAYVFLITDFYPHASPLQGEEEPEQQELEFSVG
jgi:Domain of unknown function (DUF4389)